MVRELRHLVVPHFGEHAPQISGVDPCRSSVSPNYSASWRRTSLNYMITSNETIKGRYQLSLVLLILPSFFLFIHHVLIPLSLKYALAHGKYYVQQEPSLKPQAHKNIAAKPPATAAKLMP